MCQNHLCIYRSLKRNINKQLLQMLFILRTLIW
ncbi:hypothetical protein WP4W18C03_30970 [Pseudomonas putida]|nr:hypothetical protein WP4W18C03_30970 [Pseudomonas putida]